MILITLLPILLTFTARATSFMPEPFPNTVAQTPNIVRGVISSSRSEWSKDADGIPRLYTFYQLQASETFKGDIKGALTFRELGGEKDGGRLEIPGTAEFQLGEEVVIFLKEGNTDGSFDLNGMMMGKYSIITNANGEETLVGPGLLSGDQNSETWNLKGLRQVIQKQKSNPVVVLSSPSPKRSLLSTPVTSKSLSPFEAPPFYENKWIYVFFIGLLLSGGILWTRRK